METERALAEARASANEKKRRRAIRFRRVILLVILTVILGGAYCGALWYYFDSPEAQKHFYERYHGSPKR
jgi:hypothetical protein